MKHTLQNQTNNEVSKLHVYLLSRIPIDDYFSWQIYYQAQILY